MKKNIVIVILSIIIVFLIYKTMNPTVVTERRINLRNRYSQTDLTRNIKKDSFKNANEQELPQDYNYVNNNADDDFARNFDEYRPGGNPHQQYEETPPVQRENKPIRFRTNKEQNAETPDNTISESAAQQETNKTKPKTAEKKSEAAKKPSLFAQSIKTCKPYSEKMSSEYMGVNIDYKIEILGWINNKCTINFSSKMTGVNESFRNVYGIDPSDAVITAFVPNFRCEFTKAQLIYVGDSILQEKERNSGATNNMLKNPNQINFPEFENMTADDLKLLQVVFGNKACKMLNLDELKKMFMEAMDF